MKRYIIASVVLVALTASGFIMVNQSNKNKAENSSNLDTEYSSEVSSYNKVANDLSSEIESVLDTSSLIENSSEVNSKSELSSIAESSVAESSVTESSEVESKVESKAESKVESKVDESSEPEEPVEVDALTLHLNSEEIKPSATQIFELNQVVNISGNYLRYRVTNVTIQDYIPTDEYTSECKYVANIKYEITSKRPLNYSSIPYLYIQNDNYKITTRIAADSIKGVRNLTTGNIIDIEYKVYFNNYDNTKPILILFNPTYNSNIDLKHKFRVQVNPNDITME